MTTDLSLQHKPVGSLFSFPENTDERMPFRLSTEQVEFYHENGYVSGIDILNDSEVDALCQELASLYDPEHPAADWWYEFNSNESADPSRVLFHALGAWRISPGFHDILWNPTFTVPASQLLGGAVRFWHDQLFCKPAQHGGVVAWHQDYSYWTRTQPMAHLSCWIGLDDADESNGALQYIPGSHLWDLLPITGLAGDMDAIRDVLSDEQWDALHNPVSVVLNRGQATFHHPLMVHSSRENSTDRQRRATVLNVCRDGVRSDSNEPLLAGVPIVPQGEPLGGQFFPLLYDPDSTS